MNDNEKTFKSSLKQEIEMYLQLRKLQGHDTRKDQLAFLTLDSYLFESQTGDTKIDLSQEVVEGWFKSLPKHLNVNTRNLYISNYTQFAKFLQSKGMTAFIPERALPDLTYVPHIFSKEELDYLVLAADKRLESAKASAKRNAACFSVLLRMLAGCGFRIDELLNLNTSDVDLVRRIVTVRNGKGKNDRIVPMHDTLMDTILAYIGSGIPQPDGFFFPAITGNKLSYSWARDSFNRCLEDIGIIKPDLERYARNICIHCIRHSYAVAAFQKLDHEGKDLYSEAPILSTYLGHKNISGTEKYLHMTAANSADILQKMSDYIKDIFPEVGL